MFPSEYTVKQHNLDLLREAEQRRLAQTLSSNPPVNQRIGQTLLRLGARFAVTKPEECVTVEAAGRTVTVCAA